MLLAIMPHLCTSLPSATLSSPKTILMLRRCLSSLIRTVRHFAPVLFFLSLNATLVLYTSPAKYHVRRAPVADAGNNGEDHRPCLTAAELGISSLSMIRLEETNMDEAITQVPSSAAASGNQQIYFFGTANMSFLSPKQLCVIESAALHNPERPVSVSLKQPYLLRSPGVARLLDTYDNIFFSQLSLEAWFKGTVLEKGLNRSLLAASRYRVAHESDVVRLAALYKSGGIYLDLDALVLRNLGGLKNAVGFEHGEPDSIASGVLAFDRGHPVMEHCLEAILKEYNNQEWSSVGHVMLRKVLKAWCNISPERQLGPTTCNGVHLLSHDILYQPSPSVLDWQVYYEDDAVKSNAFLDSITPNLLSLHLHNSKTARLPVRIGSNQVLAKLAAKHCPAVASTYDELWACDVHRLAAQMEPNP